MYFQIHKNKEKPYFLYLHGECLSSSSFKEEIKELKKDFTIITADITGHGKASHEIFQSIHACCDEILSFIDEHCSGHIHVLSGFSLGGQIAIELLSMRPSLCEFAMIESVLTKPIKIRNWSSYASEYTNSLAKQKWFNKFMYYTMFNDDFAFNDYHQNFQTMSVETIHNVLQETYNYTINASIVNATCNMAILVGQRERKVVKQSADILHQLVPTSQTYMLMNYTHGDFSLGNPHEYIRFVKSWVQNKDLQQRKRAKRKKDEVEGDYMPNYKHLINKVKERKYKKEEQKSPTYTSS